MHPSAHNPDQLKGDIRKVIERFLAGCEASLMLPLYDKEVHDACVAEAHRRGCFSKGDLTDSTLDRYIPMGVIMSSTTLSTIPRLETKAFLALFTALAVHIDDIASHNVEPLRRFTQNFLLRHPQGHPSLDAFASMILDFQNHFDPLVSQIMLTSSLDFVTGQLVEHNIKGTPLSAHAGQFAEYVRLSSGIAHCYALSPFPRDLPVQSYIQALPELLTYINNVNDILSFYKEEMEGEHINRVTSLSKCQNISKIEVLQRITDQTIEAYERASMIIKEIGRPEAYQAFRALVQGHVGFYACPRYRLDEVFGSNLESLSRPPQTNGNHLLVKGLDEPDSEDEEVFYNAHE